MRAKRSAAAQLSCCVGPLPVLAGVRAGRCRRLSAAARLRRCPLCRVRLEPPMPRPRCCSSARARTARTKRDLAARCIRALLCLSASEPAHEVLPLQRHRSAPFAPLASCGACSATNGADQASEGWPRGAPPDAEKKARRSSLRALSHLCWERGRERKRRRARRRFKGRRRCRRSAVGRACGPQGGAGAQGAP